MDLRFFVCCSLVCFAACSSCNYKGTVYRIGNTWVAEDRCNKCTCQSSGTVSCETKNCTVLTCHDNNRDYSLGETFKSSDGCNQCICTISGAACTLMACHQFGAGVGHTHIPRCYYYGRVYTVGDAFRAMDACNQCICTEKETVLCTEMFCPPSSLKPPETTKPPRCVYNGKVHSVGDAFKSTDGCNKCNCVSNEQVACTLMACLTMHTESMTTTVMTDATTTEATTPTTPAPVMKCDYNGRDYSIGDGFKADDGCNTCKCTSNGQVACTEMACLPTTSEVMTTIAMTETPTSKPTTPPTPATVTTCDYNGHVYSIADSFKADDGCNTCKCLKDGKVACTKMFCPPTTKASMSMSSSPSQTSLQMVSSTTSQPKTSSTDNCNYNGQVYSVGDSFKAIDGCNTCRCTAGQQVACTKMYCPTSTKQSSSTISPTTKGMPIVTTTVQSKITSTAKPIVTTTVQPIVSTTYNSQVSTTAKLTVTKTDQPVVASTSIHTFPVTTINHLKMTLN